MHPRMHTHDIAAYEGQGARTQPFEMLCRGCSFQVEAGVDNLLLVDVGGQVDAEARKRFSAAIAQPDRAVAQGIVQEIQHHAFVVTHQRDGISGAGGVDVDKQFQDGPAVGSAVDVVAEEYQIERLNPVLYRIRRDPFEQVVQQVATAMDVANRIKGLVGRQWRQKRGVSTWVLITTTALPEPFAEQIRPSHQHFGEAIVQLPDHPPHAQRAVRASNYVEFCADLWNEKRGNSPNNAEKPMTRAFATDTAPRGSFIGQIEAIEVDPFALFAVLWRRKFLIGFVGLLFALLGGLFAVFIATPYFKASSVVVLNTQLPSNFDLEAVVPGLSSDQASINTEVEVIRARGLMEKLVAVLDLTQDPEFNKELRPEPLVSVDKTVGVVRDFLGLPQLEEPAPTPEETLNKTVDSVIEAIQVANIRQSYVFRLTAVTENPVKSADIANRLAELYIQRQLDVKLEATQQSSQWLGERAAELQSELEEAEARVTEFNAGTTLISPEVLAGLNRQLKELRERRLDLEAKLELASARVVSLKVAAETGDRTTTADVAADRTLTRFLTLDDDKSFDERLASILEAAELGEARARSQVAAVTSTIDEIVLQIEDQSADLVQLGQLQREAEASRLIYEFFLARLKETSVQEGIHYADSSILSRAVVPSEPSAPRKSLIVILTGTLGLMLGSAVVLRAESRDRAFRSIEEVERATGKVVLGQIPRVPVRSRAKLLDYLVKRPNSAAAEAVRNVRTSLLLSNPDSPHQVILSTSSLPGEGKTTNTLAMAQYMASMGKKVLVLEGDIRLSTLSEYFQGGERKGLLAVLAGEAELEDAIQPIEALGVDVLLGEKSPASATELFSSERFSELLAQLRKTYDTILIDTPPVLVVPDARVIGQHADDILFSVKWDATLRAQVKEGLRLLEAVNLKSPMLILSQVDLKGQAKYGYAEGYGSSSARYYTD